jgi:hypothetical protein
MKAFKTTLALIIALGTLNALAQTAAPAAPAADAPVPVPPAPAARLSPHDTISLRLGSGRTAPLVTVTYGRPLSKREGTTEVRKIWGALVPWGAVWRMGSDEATTLITQVPLDIGGATVPAGAYTLCMFPDDKGPTKLIINKQIGQWGIPYTPAIQANELARVDMKKDTLDKQVDEFTIALVPDAASGGGVLKAFWENTMFSVPIKVKQ